MRKGGKYVGVWFVQMGVNDICAKKKNEGACASGLEGVHSWRACDGDDVVEQKRCSKAGVVRGRTAPLLVGVQQSEEAINGAEHMPCVVQTTRGYRSEDR